MAAKKKIVEQEPFEIVPLAPKDFAGAAAVNLTAKRAIDHWKEEKRYAMTTARKEFAHDKLRAWQQVNRDCETVMLSFQTRMF